MKLFLSNLVVVILSITLVVGCVTVPTRRVWQPWTRVLGDSEYIRKGASVHCSVSGETSPLLGNEKLMADDILSRLEGLLERRGFVLEDDQPEFSLLFAYKTTRSERLSTHQYSASWSRQQVSSVSGAGAGATAGLGASFAAAVADVFAASATQTAQVIEESKFFIHTISLEIHNRDNRLIWKGESTWDSQYLNILTDMIPATQLILSRLPSDDSVLPHVPEVKESHAVNYFELECAGNTYVCPALPYRTYFYYDPYGYELPGAVDDPVALAAYVDLLETAEFVVPKGSQDWEDPLKLSLWSKATLGSRYLLGPNDREVKVLIRLIGKSDGYRIERCWLATDEEFTEFENSLKRWQHTLADYYNVFED